MPLSMGHPKSILVTGGSGMIGTRLTAALLSAGHHVAHLTRGRKANSVPSFQWDIDRQYMDVRALQNVDVIIHLAGAGIGDERWTARRKNEIMLSRTRSTSLLADTLRRNPHTIQAFIGASAIGYYGYSSDAVFTESSPPGNDFLAQVTSRWEKETDMIRDVVPRVVKIRSGIVLSADGGALKELAAPVRYFVGAALGTGRQVMSWIHMDDLCGIFLKAVDDDAMQGPYNAVAPNPVTNRVMTKAIGKVLGRPIIMPKVPAFALRLVLGEMAEMVLYGSRISADRIVNAGYTFRFVNIEDALQDILRPG